MPRPPTYRERYAAMLADQGELRAHEPSLRERFSAALPDFGGYKPQVEAIAENMPYGPGTPMEVQDAAAEIERGNYLPGVAGMALAVAPIPGKKIIKETAKKAFKGGSKLAKKIAGGLSGEVEKHLSRIVKGAEKKITRTTKDALVDEAIDQLQAEKLQKQDYK